MIHWKASVPCICEGRLFLFVCCQRLDEWVDRLERGHDRWHPGGPLQRRGSAHFTRSSGEIESPGQGDDFTLGPVFAHCHKAKEHDRGAEPRPFPKGLFPDRRGVWPKLCRLSQDHETFVRKAKSLPGRHGRHGGTGRPASRLGPKASKVSAEQAVSGPSLVTRDHRHSRRSTGPRPGSEACNRV